MSEQAPSGSIRDKEHFFPLRIYYAETDAGGIVYHASYLNIAERARTEMMRLLGLDHLRLKEEEGLIFALRSLSMDFLRPAVLDDELVVRSRLVHMGGASLHVAQSIQRGGEELVSLVVRLVCMRAEDKKAGRIPVELRTKLQNYLTQEADLSHG